MVVLSQDEAGRLRHNYIGTEHVLLGLLSEPEGIGGRVLERFGMSADGVRAEVVTIVGEGQHEVQHHIPFTPRAKKTLELALREALQLNHNYIGTEHILLGLIREGDGVAAKIMRKYSDLPAIRAAVIDQVPAWGEGENGLSLGQLRRGSRGPSGGPGGFRAEPEPTASPATDTTLTEAARLAGQQPVGSHHLLLAALADVSSAAAKALAAIGIDLDRAKDALRDVDIAGTSDELPEQAGRRQMKIAVSEETVTIVAADRAMAEAGQAAIAALAASAAGGQRATPGGVIRGADLSGGAAARLEAAWQALRDSLAEIVRGAAAAAAQADKPDKPAGPEDETGTETA